MAVREAHIRATDLQGRLIRKPAQHHKETRTQQARDKIIFWNLRVLGRRTNDNSYQMFICSIFCFLFIIFFLIICEIFFSPYAIQFQFIIFFVVVIPPQWLVLPPLDGNTHVYNKSFFVDVYYLFKNAWESVIIREINK